MVVLLPDRMAQSVMPMAVSVDPLVKLGVQMRLLQGVFVRRSVFQFLQLFVGFPADGGGGGATSCRGLEPLVLLRVPCSWYKPSTSSRPLAQTL